MTYKRVIDYLDDFVPRQVDTRLLYYGPPYNRICARCNARWSFGEPPEHMDGVELEIQKCPACANRKRAVGWRLNMNDREVQMDRIAKYKESDK